MRKWPDEMLVFLDREDYFTEQALTSIRNEKDGPQMNNNIYERVYASMYLSVF